MGFYRGPKIVTDGLVLYLDAANHKSYPGSGTTLKDMSGSGLNGTIVGSPPFSTDNGGILDFDGSSDYVTCGTTDAVDLIQNQTNFTLAIWFKMDALASLRGLIGTLNYGCTKNLGLVANNTSLNFYNDNESCYSVNIYNYVEVGKWIYAAGTYDGTTTRTYGFKDGVLTQASGTSKSGPANTFSSDFQVWGDQYGTYYTDCKGGLAQVYNRTLSAQEIQQNYNATKSRFGL